MSATPTNVAAAMILDSLGHPVLQYYDPTQTPPTFVAVTPSTPLPGSGGGGNGGGGGAVTAVQLPPALGAQAAGSSLSVVPATSTTFPVSATQLPSALGAQTKALSLSVTQASDAFSKLVAGIKTALTVTGLSTLASANYVASNVKDNTANQPIEVMVEVTANTTNTVAGNKQLVVFAQASFDNSVYQSGPTSGTTTTDEPDLTYLGTVPMNTGNVSHTKSFPLAAAYGGVVPPYVKYILKNDLGVALTSASVSTIEITYKAA